MKQLLKHLLVAAAVAGSAACAFDAQAVELREHRAVWCTPYLADWPSSAITTATAQRHKDILIKNLERYKSQHINVIYYHVRSMCDATYDSKYEPWSKGVSGTRGKAPAFDPLEYLLQEAHARGIEVYAWINPYRYCGKYDHEDTPLNYTNTHPEWLIVQPEKESILNPALEEVQQRIVDVVMDIMDKYPIDGVVFDDYFYSSPTPNSLDEDLYNAAKQADPTVGTQNQWRVANVNKMITRVYNAIKARAPWMPFGISPAGTASPPNIRDYGLEPGPDGDWQYQSIASDPISWFAAGIVDYMSPQIYWPGKFDRLQAWWATAATHFNRHLYSSVSLSEYSSYGNEEFNREAIVARDYLPENESGIVFFTHKTYVNAEERVDGNFVSLGESLKANAFATPVLTPLRCWNNEYAPAMTANVHRDGNTLTWDAVDGARYTVYTFAPGEEPMTLGANFVQICYDNHIEIPEGLEKNTFGVCVYDRYGNEYSMLLEGAQPGTAKAAELTYPADASSAADLFDFTWKPTGADNILEVASDAEFKNLLGTLSTRSSAVNAANFPRIECGNTYYWRVRTHPVNAPATVSDVRSFVASKIEVTAPTGNAASTAPTIEWTPAFEGSTYKVEISRRSDFKTLEFEGEAAEPKLDLPENALVTGYKYYVRVTGERDGRQSQSAVATFSTADVTYEAPKLLNPATAGATIYANQGVRVNDWTGMDAVVVQISTTPEFPGRSIYKCTLKKGETITPDLSTIKVATKALVDGTTYYVRAFGQYFLQSNGTSTVETEYATSSFVYSSELGISDAVTDAEGVYIADGILNLPAEGFVVDIFTADGRAVRHESHSSRTISLNALASGLYIIKAGNQVLKWAK